MILYNILNIFGNFSISNKSSSVQPFGKCHVLRKGMFGIERLILWWTKLSNELLFLPHRRQRESQSRTSLPCKPNKKSSVVVTLKIVNH